MSEKSTGTIVLIVVETNSNEADLFYQMVQRGQHADIPCYFSTEKFNWEEGCVSFHRLDCAPRPCFKVVVSGNCLLVSQRNIIEVECWLLQWQVEHDRKTFHTFSSPEEVWEFIRSHRQETAPTEKSRKEMGQKVLQKIRDRAAAEDRMFDL